MSKFTIERHPRFGNAIWPAAALDTPAATELVELLAAVRRARVLTQEFIDTHLNGCGCDFCTFAALLGDDDTFHVPDVRSGLSALATVAESIVGASIEPMLPGCLEARVDQLAAADAEAHGRHCTCKADVA